MSTPEINLVQQLSTLYSEHEGWLRGWLRKKLGCSHKAADVLQDTFIRLLAKEEPLALQEPRAFLTTVAKRILFTQWRREEIEHAYLRALAQLPENLAPSPEEQSIVLETLIEIDRLLEGLPPPVKRAFLLSQLDGMRHSEIGAAMAISVTTVKRYLMRASAQCYFALAV